MSSKMRAAVERFIGSNPLASFDDVDLYLVKHGFNGYDRQIVHDAMSREFPNHDFSSKPGRGINGAPVGGFWDNFWRAELQTAF